ncbi:MAG: class I SAM-dependent RNA methyltransferase [Spirochaetes bacterium]|nr:MAG: class I SAM-dependent RNA methyltransferase [Spirochaetota bacterium]
MPFRTLIATSAFGIESIVAGELTALGYQGLAVENGRVAFQGDDRDIARCNLWLRTADRLLLRMAEFRAMDFEELFQGVKAIPWETIIPENGKMHVTGKSVRSKLFSVPDCQAIVKKAVVERMKTKYRREYFREDGPVYKIEVGLLKDIATITVDTSGPGLHKRGYREERGEAPLRETLAAAIVLMSRWEPSRIFADPLCGSGTIPIEAALIGRNRAPGIKRSFVAETWPHIPGKIWKEAREEARDLERESEMNILASDSDWGVFKSARANAAHAGVDDAITFQHKPLAEFGSKKKFGCIVTNPPYGERMGDREAAEKLYREMGEVFARLDSWSYFILSSHDEFQKHFGKHSHKNRKLYNGRILCYLYQYFGPLPPRKREPGGGDQGNMAEGNE